MSKLTLILFYLVIFNSSFIMAQNENEEGAFPIKCLVESYETVGPDYETTPDSSLVKRNYIGIRVITHVQKDDSVVIKKSPLQMEGYGPVQVLANSKNDGLMSKYEELLENLVNDGICY